jgi:hypothetical protein
MHWAAHGRTAAEVIARRADSGQPNMGLTTWTGSRPRRTDASVAKNYLDRQEIRDAQPDCLGLSRFRGTSGAQPQAKDDARMDRQARQRSSS